MSTNHIFINELKLGELIRASNKHQPWIHKTGRVQEITPAATFHWVKIDGFNYSTLAFDFFKE